MTSDGSILSDRPTAGRSRPRRRHGALHQRLIAEVEANARLSLVVGTDADGKPVTAKRVLGRRARRKLQEGTDAELRAQTRRCWILAANCALSTGTP